MISTKNEIRSLLSSNFDLDKDDFLEMVELLKIGDERILHVIAKHQFKKGMQYLKRNYYMSDDYAYDLCMDTLLVFRRKLLANKLVYGNLSYLFNKMAANLYIDRIKIKKKEATAVNQFFELSQASESEEDVEPFYEALNVALDSLSEDDLTLIKEIYHFDKKLVDIAKNESVSDSTIRKRKQRLLEKLRNNFSPILINLTKK